MATVIRTNRFREMLATTQGKTYAVGLVTAITVVLMLVFAISPAYVSVTTKIEENGRKQEYFDQLIAKQKKLADLGNQTTEKSKEIDLLNAYFPDQQNDEFFLANITALGSSAGANVTSVSFNRDAGRDIPSALDAFPLLQRIKISVNATGSLTELENVVTNIENFPATITIRALSYAVEDETGEYTMTISAEYYFWDTAEI